ncbi:MAG: hypothetical protein KJ622_15665 [Alphaproteobacteria bacterium]|nr:hypothetical protein [Alphaproteobacteria bacterium]
MLVENARFANAAGTAVVADFEGVTVSFPATPGNRHYEALVAAGATPLPYVPPPPSADDVRAEASRRMQVLVGARDADHLEIIIANASREAIRLLRIGEANWTPEEAARAAALEQVDAMLEAIRAASNAMEADPPADYTDDRHWP